jgi:hypothetical protein
MNWVTRFLKRDHLCHFERLSATIVLNARKAIFPSKGFACLLIAGLSFFLWGPLPLISASSVENQVVYINSGGDSFAATLVPDHPSGSVPNDPTLVEAATNEESTAFQLVPGSEGQIDLGGKLPGLEDGRHRGAIKTLTLDGGRKDRKELLFIVDSKPPLIERVEPEGDLFPRSAGAIRFRVTDPEDGSGVSIDPAECVLKVAVSGATLQNKILSFTENELNLTVFVAFPGGAAEHDADFTVSVSLQDRAGNVGRASETFTIRSLVSPQFTVYQCGHQDTYTEAGGEFLVEPAYSAMALRVGRDRQLDVFVRGCFGKNYHYPDNIRSIMKSNGIDRETEAETVTMNTYFQEVVGDLIDIQSASGNVTIHKQEDSDFKDSRVSFRIRQQNPAPMGDQMETLLVTVPVAFRLDSSKVNFCESRNQVDPFNPDDCIYHHIPTDAFSYTFETISIPVYLEAASAPFSLSVAQEDDQLTATVETSPIELMDTAASWFAFEGDKYWFERHGEDCVAKGPAREGMVHYQIAAAHKIAEFSGMQGDSAANSRTMLSEGDILVCLDPPEIKNFRYDRETNALHADIDDLGTPREALAIELWLSSYRLEAEFDPETGQLTATLPYTPLSVLTASLKVTDFAEQTTTDNCQVFGEVASEDEGAAQDSDSSTRGPYTYTPNTGDIDRVIGTKGNGKALVEICEDVMKWGYFENGRFVPMDSQPGSMRLVQLRSRDPGNADESSMAVSKNLPIYMEIFGYRYDTSRYEPIPEGAGGITSISITGGQSASGAGRDFYFAVMARDGNRNIPLRNTGFGFGLFFTLKEFKQCRMEERDILAPVIRPRFDPATDHLTASIHDHGMPLSELKINLTAKTDSTRNIAGWKHHLHSTGSRPPFTFQNGILTSQFVPPSRGEFFVFEIIAEDKAGNRNRVVVDVMMPREPPEVSLVAETQQTGHVIRRHGEQASAYMTAEAKDDSQIVVEQTTLWLDDQVLRPCIMYSHTKEAGWRSLFNFKASYVAGVEEGSHLARFRATDATGLWAETVANFDFQLAPVISNFKTMPDAVRKIGGPALTAMVIDRGGDLDISGMALTIDGQPVDATSLFYDAASGYFSVDGPLELAEGLHVANITATDSHGNQARDSLRFTRAMEISTPFQSSGQGLVIDGLTLMELEDHNGDGRANPGELVRLFIALRNDTGDDLSCIGRLSSEDPDIAVETESVNYGTMEAGNTLLPMQGFELRIGSDVLTKTISDPYEAYLGLTLDCDGGQEWHLPLTIPIHQPSIPIDTGMTLSLDRLPPSTSADTFRLQGTITSRAEFVDWMALRVNGVRQGPVTFNRAGGRFEAVVNLADGANTIEVTGADSNGARGSAAGYIFRTTTFVLPSIAITSPASGDYFVCDNLTVTGTYSTGSGTLRSITAIGPWGAGDTCPTTIIDGTNFSVNCGDVTYGPAGIYDIEATIETTDGVQAVDTITISVGDCS